MGRVVLILTAAAAIVAAGFVLVSSFFFPQDLILEKQRELPEGRAIVVKTKVERFGVHKGDAFPYFVEIWYNPEQVLEIDRSGLDKNLNLKPFEVRSIREREFNVDAKTKVYQKEYEIQLIDGKVNHVYTFPAISVRYKLKNSEGYLDTLNDPAPPQSIFVAPRLPADMKRIEFRPIKGKITGVNQHNLSLILWVLGGILAVLGVIDLLWRGIPRWREIAEQRRKGEGIDVLSEAYHSLYENVETGLESKDLLHQINHILRVVLVRKEKTDWLEGPNLDHLSPEIRPTVVSLFEKSLKAYSSAATEQKDIEEALRQLKEVLSFYFGEGEVEAWRS